MLLWQARLVLKLAEIHEIEQAEVTAALTRIAQRQEALLAELREETEELFALTEQLAGARGQVEAALANRLKAWSRLVVHASLQDCPQFLVTRHEAVMETLMERYERLCGRAPRRLAPLELPRNGASAPPDSGWEKMIASPIAERLQAVTGHLQGDSSNQAGLEQAIALFNRSKADWEAALERRWSVRAWSRCRLEMACFPGISARRLFLSGLAGKVETDVIEQDEARGVMVGLLSDDQ
jgi:hypothetical protein